MNKIDSSGKSFIKSNFSNRMVIPGFMAIILANVFGKLNLHSRRTYVSLGYSIDGYTMTIAAMRKFVRSDAYRRFIEQSDFLKELFIELKIPYVPKFLNYDESSLLFPYIIAEESISGNIVFTSCSSQSAQFLYFAYIFQRQRLSFTETLVTFNKSNLISKLKSIKGVIQDESDGEDYSIIFENTLIPVNSESHFLYNAIITKYNLIYGTLINDLFVMFAKIKSFSILSCVDELSNKSSYLISFNAGKT